MSVEVYDPEHCEGCKADGHGHSGGYNMKEFRLKIKMGNDAMTTPDNVAEALETVQRKLREGDEYGSIRDANGNRVGDWLLTEAD